MPPIRMNRRGFLGYSAAAGIALANGPGAEAASNRSVRLGLVGLGGRGTALLRAALELPGVEVVALADPELKHRIRGQGIAEKAAGIRPEAVDSALRVFERGDVEAVLVATPCDLHAELDREALRAGKHLYAEKPLALTVGQCDALIAEAARRPDLAVHVGHQRRSNPRYRDGVELLRRGDLGEPIEARAVWSSSNGPVSGHGGWLARRDRSGDWMVEQAVHVWDVLHGIAGGPPSRAIGTGRRDVFRSIQPDRDVTDWYSAHLQWDSGFVASMTHSWIDPADDAFTGVSLRVVASAGGFDFGSGTATPRDRSRPRKTIHPGNLPETRLALEAFVAAIRSPEPTPPPISLAEAKEAVVTGLLVRTAVDERRVVSREEIV